MRRILSHRALYLGTGILFLVLFCFVAGLVISLLDFPDSLFGQTNLSREYKPFAPPAYQSAEFVLGQVSPSDVQQAFYIHLSEDVLFWDPYYVGFPRTELSPDEVSALKDLLTAGTLFYNAPDGISHKCVRNQVLEPCPQGREYLQEYVERQWDATQKHGHGVLLFFLRDGRLVEIRLALSERGLSFTPVEKGGDWWLKGLANSSSLLDALARRAIVPPLDTLWPELNADQANDKAAKILGSRYQKALDFVRSSSAVQNIFGSIREIRPAKGNNYTSDWMDSASIFLTLKVSGARGDGVILVQGDPCFDLQMVFNGQPLDDGNSYVCP